MKNQYNVIGIMSGSSLDGLDICFSGFSFVKEAWSYEIIKTETIDLDEALKEALRNAALVSRQELSQLDLRYGQWIGDQINQFISDQNLPSIDLISVHGHTVFHEPAKGVSLQIGNAGEIAKRTKLTIVDNFRIGDIKNGGQGAPLVPVGEHYLFADYDSCVNFGGIANISINKNGKMTAWDVCPCNQVLNYYATKKGLIFDRGGTLAKSGGIDQNWYDFILEKSYFNEAPPKSLSNQWGLENVIGSCDLSIEDTLRTYTEIIAALIAEAIKNNLPENAKVLFTGGGVYNEFLMACIRERLGGSHQMIIPDKSIVEFKEALIFGFLGLLSKLEIPNVFGSVTGATKDTIAGEITSVFN